MTTKFEELPKIKAACMRLLENPNNASYIKEFKDIVVAAPSTFIKATQSLILSAFYPILKNISEQKSSLTEDERRLVIDVLKTIFDKSYVNKIGLFFNLYALLLFEIYDHVRHQVRKIHEEYKLSIICCATSLMNSVSMELLMDLYNKENAPKLCQMLYVAIELAKTEHFRTLRIAAIECVMALSKVYKEDDFNDFVTRNQIADVFAFFLPGLASGLLLVALSDEKVGHKVPKVAIKAWGRIISLFLTDYHGISNKKFKPNIQNLLNELLPETKITDVNELKEPCSVTECLDSAKRTQEWFVMNDRKLQKCMIEFKKLTHHSHHLVRLELAQMSSLLIAHCLHTIPTCISHTIEILIILSEDEHEDVVEISKTTLNSLSERLSEDEFKTLLENLEESFYNTITSLTRIFNGIDEREQLAALNLLIGYINLFGTYKLCHVLHSVTHLNKLVSMLIDISELEHVVISPEENFTLDLELESDKTVRWKRFIHFKDDSIKRRLEALCHSLTKHGALEIMSDFLLDIYLYDSEHKKEATFLLNELLTGISDPDDYSTLKKNLITIYIDEENWNVPLHVMVDNYGVKQSNIVQVCLQLEGIGKIALVLRKNFKLYLLKTLFLVLIKAGSSQQLIRMAGTEALRNMALACEYTDIPTLISLNIDYFSFYVERQLKKVGENEDVFNVLAVVLKHGTIDILQSLMNVIKEVLMDSCDQFKQRKATAYLRIFKLFVESLSRWLNVVKSVSVFKTKAQKLEDIQGFQVSGIEENDDFSDDIMGKSAEELYKEDMEKSENELENDILVPEEEYKKPEPPMPIKLTIAILKRSLHFLASKDRVRRLQVLEILNDGLELIREWEDELLPIVHQIWSPLVGRFKEMDEPLIINWSVRLLSTMARLSKDFIRSRTAKDALPSIIKALKKFATESYLKDKGSAYRYTQSYKLQITILENITFIITDIDLLEGDMVMIMEAVQTYLDAKQPRLLQELAVIFFQKLILYDPSLKSQIYSWSSDNENKKYEKNIEVILNNCNKSVNSYLFIFPFLRFKC